MVHNTYVCIAENKPAFNFASPTSTFAFGAAKTTAATASPCKLMRLLQSMAVPRSNGFLPPIVFYITYLFVTEI